MRKVLRSDATQFRYEREHHQPMPKMGLWRDELNCILASNQAQVTRERLTLFRIYEKLRERDEDIYLHAKVLMDDACGGLAFEPR